MTSSIINILFFTSFLISSYDFIFTFSLFIYFFFRYLSMRQNIQPENNFKRWAYAIYMSFFKIFIVIQLQLYAFSPHPSTPPQHVFYKRYLLTFAFSRLFYIFLFLYFADWIDPVLFGLFKHSNFSNDNFWLLYNLFFIMF